MICYVDLEVRFRYGSKKAAWLEHIDDREVVAVLREDLNALKMVHPKADTIRWNYPSSIYFSWRTHKGSLLWKQVHSAVNCANPETKAACEIEDMLVVEKRNQLTPDSSQNPNPPRSRKPYIAMSQSPSAPAPQSVGSVRERYPPVFPVSPSKRQRITSQQLADETIPSSHGSIDVEAAITPHVPPAGPKIVHAPLTASISSQSDPRSQCSPAAVSAPQTSNTPVPLDTASRTNMLMRELWDTRRQVAANQARETAILNDLHSLGALNIPSPNKGPPDGATIPVLRARLAMAELELRAERHRRTEAVQALADVERECREPFVVPALLEAFARITEILPS